MIAIGRRYGVRVDPCLGPWVSLGVHAHVWPPHKAHVDLHLLWWLFTFGRHYAGPKKKRCWFWWRHDWSYEPLVGTHRPKRQCRRCARREEAFYLPSDYGTRWHKEEN